MRLQWLVAIEVIEDLGLLAFALEAGLVQPQMLDLALVIALPLPSPFLARRLHGSGARLLAPVR